MSDSTKAEVEITFTKIKEKDPTIDDPNNPKTPDYSDGMYINGVKLMTGNQTTSDLKISYKDLLDKPTINGTTVEGDMISSTRLLDFE